jgi:release factor glutamine methyltransferase
VTVVSTSTWAELYKVVAERLGDGREARWMVEEASGQSWPEILDGDRPAPEPARRRLVSMVDRRKSGEPLQYVLGSWEFRRLDLMVDRRVLIPRPETEQVVEVALAEIDRLAAKQAADPARRYAGGPADLDGAPPEAPKRMPQATDRLVVVDLGTGSGAIALSIAAERERVDVWATDLSADAIAVAQANLSGMGGFAATRVRVVPGDWWSALPEALRRSVDVVVSNPPYISSGEVATLDPEVRRWEPRAALEAGPTGLEAVHEILNRAAEWLRPGGVAVIEIAPHQSAAAEQAARRAGFVDVTVRPDLAGRDRVLVARGAP